MMIGAADHSHKEANVLRRSTLNEIHKRRKHRSLSSPSFSAHFLQFVQVLCISLIVGAACAKPDSSGLLLNFFSKNHGLDCVQPPSMCRAHSHNDYHQADPLSSAIMHGLKSVEVDVFPRKGGLWVAHTFLELSPKRTIDNLYIQPLLDIFRRQDRLAFLEKKVQDAASTATTSEVRSRATSVSSLQRRLRPSPPIARILTAHPRGGSDIPRLTRATTAMPVPRGANNRVDNLSLLVDFKGDADKSASLLQTALLPLRPFLSKVDRRGTFRQGRLTVLISGNRPSVGSLQASNGERYLFLDGRIKDVQSNVDTRLVPLVSVPWRQVQCRGPIGERYMKRLSQKAHAQGKLIRIWGAPNKERTWRSMLRGNIDFLSIDDHPKFAQFVSCNSGMAKSDPKK